MVIAGTGSVAAGANTQGKITRVGGWGSVVDDRGSAYNIGKDALYLAMRAHDARGPSTVLLRKLMKRMRVKQPEGLIEKVYLGKMEIAEIASLSTIVAQAAKGGDGVSRHLLEEKGALLGELAVTAARRVSILRRKFGVAPVGGVFKSGPILRDAFERRIKASAPLAYVVRPILPPVGGAILLSLKMAGANVDEVVIRHLQALPLLVGQDFMRTQGGLTSKTLMGYS